MHFKSYTPEHPPKRGTARKIWRSMSRAGIKVWELHYNPNCWMRGLVSGWATWAGRFTAENETLECWCGWHEDAGSAYIQLSYAPFTWVLVEKREGEDARTDSGTG